MPRCKGPRIVRRIIAAGAIALSLVVGAAIDGAAAQSPPAPDEPASRPAITQSAPDARPADLEPALRATLARFGSFARHPRYGEVWVPNVTPPGWHPYPPCHWVRTKRLGWYFDDATPWGDIVHHYGRWAHDAAMGWIWVPGAAYAPGWVVWRASPAWVGWAPMPPDQDMTTITADRLDGGDAWTFTDAARFAAGCTADAVAAPARIPALLQQAPYVRDIAFVDGIAVFVLPASVTAAFSDFDFHVPAWPEHVLADALIGWSSIWNDGRDAAVAASSDCGPPAPPPLVPVSSCPPGTFPEPGGECAIYAPPACPERTVLDAGGACAPVGPTDCPRGSFPGPSGQCELIPPPACPSGTSLGRDHRCVPFCAPGAPTAGCRPPPAPVCAPGSHALGGTCVPDGPSCPGNGQRLPSGQCPPVPLVCGSGAHAANGQCVPDVAAPPPPVVVPPRPAPPPPVVVTPRPAAPPPVVVTPPARPRFAPAPVVRPRIVARPPARGRIPAARGRVPLKPVFVAPRRAAAPHAAKPKPPAAPPARGCGRRGQPPCRR